MQKKYVQKLFIFLTILAGTCFSFVSLAQAETLNEKSDEKKEELDELLEEKKSYQKILDIKTKQEQLVSSQVQSLQAQADTVEKNIRENEEKAEQLEREIGVLSQEIQAKNILVDMKKIALSHLMRDFYDKKQSGFLTAFFGVGAGGAFLASQDHSIQLQSRVMTVLEEIKVTKSVLEEDKKELDLKQADLETVVDRLEKQGIYLEGATQDKQKVLSQTQQEKGKYAWRLSNVEEKIKEIEQEIAEIEAAKINGLDLSSMPAAKKGLLAYPVGSVRITQNYGKTTFTRWYTFHNGIDFGGPTGTPIFSVADGKVIADGDSGNYAYGKWIAIEHEKGGKKLVTLYGHLSKKRVKKGDSVAQGQKIGDMGSTGYSTGPHLHFSVFSASSFEVVDSAKVSGIKVPIGAHVNPMKYLE